MVGNGLPLHNPPMPAAGSVNLPCGPEAGGLTYHELFFLGGAARALQPRGVFEIGTFNGLSVATFILNSPPTARITTLDLPRGSDAKGAGEDPHFIEHRQLGLIPESLGLKDRYNQLLCDSMQFDPSPYRDSIDLGFIDGAHDLEHVRNDTEKLATMITARGIVFWHDYGGHRMHRGLTKYLNGLGQKAEIYRIADTWLAWCYGEQIKKALGS